MKKFHLFLIYFPFIFGFCHAQNKFPCLIYETIPNCGFEELVEIDFNCINRSDTVMFLSKEEIRFLNAQFDINNLDGYHSMPEDLTLDTLNWGERGSRILYKSSYSEVILIKYLNFLALFNLTYGKENKIAYSYSLPNPDCKNCDPCQCDQQIGLGYSWSFKGGSELVSIYISTEFEELALYVDRLFFD